MQGTLPTKEVKLGPSLSPGASLTWFPRWAPPPNSSHDPLAWILTEACLLLLPASRALSLLFPLLGTPFLQVWASAHTQGLRSELLEHLRSECPLRSSERVLAPSVLPESEGRRSPTTAGSLAGLGSIWLHCWGQCLGERVRLTPSGNAHCPLQQRQQSTPGPLPASRGCPRKHPQVLWVMGNEQQLKL